MTAFWESMDLLSKIMFCLGLASTVALTIQVIFLIIGFAGGSLGDVDGFGADGDIDVDDGSAGAEVGFFTLKGILAFFAIGGWVGLGMNMAGLHIALVLAVAIVCGTIGLIGVGYLYRALYKLQSSGNINTDNAVGKIAEVYLTIPPKGVGKITLNVQERFMEFEARSNAERAIKTGERVKVVEKADGMLIVSPLEEE
jgi:hypothetical protein